MTTPPRTRRASLESWQPEPEAADWREVRNFLRRHWKAGEHGAVFAPTGTGKSYLWSRLLAPMWSHSLSIDGKFGDPDNIAHARALGARRIKSMPHTDVGKWLGRDPWPDKHYWLEPSEDRIFAEVDAALRSIFANPKGSIRTVWIDEWKVAARPPDGYGLFPIMSKILRQGRGRGITLIGATQDPFWMGPSGRDLKSQCRWYFFGRTRDADSLDSYRGISGLDKSLIYSLLPRLGKHEWLLWAPDHEILVTFTLPGPSVMKGRARQ